MQKQFETKVRTDQEGFENLPDRAVIILDTEAAKEIIRLSKLVEVEGLYKVEQIDPRVMFVNLASDAGADDMSEHLQEMELLAKVGNARSASTDDERYLTDAGLIYSNSDGWLSLSDEGKRQLQAAGYEFDAHQGWIITSEPAPAQEPVSVELETLNVSKDAFWYSANYKNTDYEFRSEHIDIADLANTFGLTEQDEPTQGMPGVTSEELKVYSFDNNDILLAALITITNSGYSGPMMIVQPEDGKLPSIGASLPLEIEEALKNAHPTWGYIQEGGSSNEMYMHWYDSPEKANAGRIECASSYYRTSDIFEISASMSALGEQVAELCKTAAMAAMTVQYADDQTEDFDAPQNIEAVEVTPELIKLVASEFIAVVRERLTPHEVAVAMARNQGDVLKGQPGACHTHDFMDANEAMAEGLVRAGVVSSGELAAHEAYTELWNEAWALARELKFVNAGLPKASFQATQVNTPATSASKPARKP